MFLLALALALPDALLHRPYAPEARWERVAVRCAMPIPATKLIGGALPPGLRMSVRGEISGTAIEPGDYLFTVEVSDGCSQRVEERRIRVMPAPILVAEAETLEFRCIHGAPPFSGGVVRVSGSAPGRPYRVDIFHQQKPWLRAAMIDGALPVDGSALEADVLNISIDPGLLPAGLYKARLRVSTWQGANAPEILFTLHVDAAASLFASPADIPPTLPVRPVVIETPPFEAMPPGVPSRAAPRFPKAKAAATAKTNGRSRILPFPKVTIQPKPKAAPQRTKPSAMPPKPPHD